MQIFSIEHRPRRYAGSWGAYCSTVLAGEGLRMMRAIRVRESRLLIHRVTPGERCRVTAPRGCDLTHADHCLSRILPSANHGNNRKFGHASAIVRVLISAKMLRCASRCKPLQPGCSSGIWSCAPVCITSHFAQRPQLCQQMYERTTISD
jgi:hypothetical protein